MNLNKVILAGRMTADPELRTTPAGGQVVSFSLATNRFWRDKEGKRQEATEFHNVVVWGRQAEVVSQFCKKGSMILIEGRLQTRNWEGKDGQTRRTTEVIAENIQLGPRGSEGGGAYDSQERPDAAEGVDNDTKAEVPVIDVDEGSGDEDKIKPEDLPF